MSCSPYDLRDYLFEELTTAQQGELRVHLKSCAPCTTELDALRATHATLLSLRDEEIPQRIGFVSDKVFEPSPFRRWLAGFWTSSARLGFVSAAMLSAAILVHAVHNPAQSAQSGLHNSAQSAQQVTFTQAELDARINRAVAAQVATQVNAQVQAKVADAVTQAVAETEQRAQKRTTALLAAAEKHIDRARWFDAVTADNSRYSGMVKNAEMVRANYQGIQQ